MANNDEHTTDRRGFLECMAWVGTGVLWTLKGGVLTSRTLAQEATPEDAAVNAAIVKSFKTRVRTCDPFQRVDPT